MSFTKARRASPVRHPYAALAACLLCLLLPTHTLAAPAADDIVVVASKGDVQITMAGATRPAQAGSTLALPATVRTGPDSSVDLRQGETTIGVGPGTQLEFPVPTQSAAALERVVQPRGNAFYDVSPREGRRFRVETPWLVAVIKGTQFNVSADAESTTISLFEGRLEVLATDGDSVVELNAGEVATRRRGEEAIRVLNLNDEKAAFALPDSAARGGTTSGLLPREEADALPELAPDGTSLDRQADDVLPPDGEEIASGVLDDSIDVGDEIGSVATSDVEADLDLDAGGIDADIGADLDVGTIDAGLDTDIDLNEGSVDAGTDVGADLGDAGIDAGADLGADLDDGTVDAGLDADADLDAGAVDAGLDADVDGGVDLDEGSIDAGTDVGADLGDAGIDAGADLGADLDEGTVDAGVDTDLLGTDTSADLGLDLEGEDAGLDVGLDLDGDGEGEEDGDGDGDEDESGGLLDGLLRNRD